MILGIDIENFKNAIKVKLEFSVVFSNGHTAKI